MKHQIELQNTRDFEWSLEEECSGCMKRRIGWTSDIEELLDPQMSRDEIFSKWASQFLDEMMK